MAATSSGKAAAGGAATPTSAAPPSVVDREEWVRRRPGQMHAGTHYILTGPRDSEKLVVCIPGLGGIHMYYAELEPALVAQGYRVLRYDLMGRGWSEPAPGHFQRKPPACCLGGSCLPVEDDPYALESHVQQLHGLLRGLNLVKEGGDAAEDEAAAAAADAKRADRLSISVSGSRRQRDLDASISSSTSSYASASTSATTKQGVMDGSHAQTWPPQPQQSPRSAAAAAAAAAGAGAGSTTASTATTTSTTTSTTSSSSKGGLAPVPEAHAVTATIAHRPVRQVHLVGHSMGGAIACGFADRFPDLVATLTLLTPAGLMDPGQFTLLRALPCCIQKIVQSGMRRAVANAVRNDFLVHDSPLEARVLEQVMLNLKHNPAAHDAVFRSVLAFPLSGLDEVVQRVAATRVPTLLIWALYDRVLPFEPHYGRWKALLRTGANVRYEVIEDACHGFPLERPERTNQIILRFLKAPPTFLPTAVLQNLQSHPPTITI